MIRVSRSLVIGLWSAAVLAIAVPTALVLYQRQNQLASVILIAGLSASALSIGWIVTQHNAYRAELASQTRRFKDAFENLGQRLTMYDHDNKLVICNSRYHEIYGLDPEIVDLESTCAPSRGSCMPTSCRTSISTNARRSSMRRYTSARALRKLDPCRTGEYCRLRAICAPRADGL